MKITTRDRLSACANFIQCTENSLNQILDSNEESDRTLLATVTALKFSLQITKVTLRSLLKTSN